MNNQGLSLKERAKRLERIQAKHMKEKENNLINQFEDSQGSLIGRINYPGGRSSTSSGYSSGSLSSNNSRDSSLGGNYYRRKNVGQDKSFPLDPVAGNKGKEEKRPTRRGYSLERSRKAVNTKRKDKHRALSEPPKSSTRGRLSINIMQEEGKHQSLSTSGVRGDRKSIKLEGYTKSGNQSLKSTNKEHPNPPEIAPKPGLVQCKNCSRNFAADRIEKHRNICKKMVKKRKPFNVSKARVEGTDAANFVGQRTQTNKTPPKSDWRKKREEFVSALRAAKEAQRYVAKGGNIKDLPPPPPMDTSHYVQCPHCNRKFSESVADRHIPECSNIKSNKKEK